MKILQINTTVNSGSHGRIADEIGLSLIDAGHESYVAAAFTGRPSRSQVIKIGCKTDRYLHALKTRLFDRHGFGSEIPTRALVEKIKKINPDIIHLHNLHGYYIHIGVLFQYLKSAGKPVVWTLHDCWPFTGHCSHFDRVNCFKWQSECNICPNKRGYPASWWLDNSRRNFYEKKRLFSGLNKMIIVTPSLWLADHVIKSFLNDYEVRIIHNGVDLNVFRPDDASLAVKKYNLSYNYILGVSNVWTESKGLRDFIQLRKLLNSEIQVVLVGLNEKKIKNLPAGITGIYRTENVNKLAELYSGAMVFVNPTYVDNFPAVNIEALACGTPVVTYKTGGSPEATDSETGFAVEKGDVGGLARV
ncbi:MAG: glycosyltransferase, partial [Bacteroidales bacterium]|nr:glycosyltransferase [Bacteroidales bacterium]